MRPQLNIEKLAKLNTADKHFTERYGEMGVSTRLEFESKARAWYFAEILRDARKSAHISQQQLADKIGKKREYITILEKGETDMQLSTFIMISEALGLKFALTF